MSDGMVAWRSGGNLQTWRWRGNPRGRGANAGAPQWWGIGALVCTQLRTSAAVHAQTDICRQKASSREVRRIIRVLSKSCLPDLPSVLMLLSLCSSYRNAGVQAVHSVPIARPYSAKYPSGKVLSTERSSSEVTVLCRSCMQLITA